jgi:hypothetical protein
MTLVNCPTLPPELLRLLDELREKEQQMGSGRAPTSRGG